MPRLQAFTLLEMLLVLAISGMLFVLSVSAGTRTRDAFAANQLIKELVLTTRTGRRQSMLIKRNPGEGWVFGVGIQLRKEGEAFTYTTVKLLKPNNTSIFYVKYPESIATYEFKTSGTPSSVDINTQILFQDDQGNPLNCAFPLTIIFEAINGAPHFYCGENRQELQRDLIYITTNIQTNKLLIRKNGEISTN